MDKRAFLAAGAALVAGAATPALARKKEKPAPAPEPATPAPVLLTVSGAITRSNRGALDPVFDQLLKKQNVHFNSAWALTWADLLKMPLVEITATLEYDGKPHVLKGPYLAQLLATAGAPTRDGTKVLLRAIDGYAAGVSLGDIRKYRYIVATHIDGKPIPLGGLGPLWGVYAPDSFPEMTAKPLPDRYAACPWGMYHIEVLTG
ncbi:hypothetical protein HNQ50_003305 [Silvimonas terrae]|uniref:Molybdopterin-dependent oxidoreductase n=1 Tax=Silvimonas terrae TaxID=300266 RepID=A0A840RK84_9NEIS|nr:molybdopterin-dependent oxidoreductase [Silvimonas terrae]MBB5192561.1 hypothetical protein [Silvimonas terrae]